MKTGLVEFVTSRSKFSGVSSNTLSVRARAFDPALMNAVTPITLAAIASRRRVSHERVSSTSDALDVSLDVELGRARAETAPRRARDASADDERIVGVAIDARCAVVIARVDKCLYSIYHKRG